MELKPCPFCGGEAEVLESDHSATFYCWCDSCETRGNYYNTEAEAIEAWNTRTVLTCTKETAEKWNRRSRVRCCECVHWREVRMADGTVTHRCSGVMAYVTPDEDGYCKWGRRVADDRQGD